MPKDPRRQGLTNRSGRGIGVGGESPRQIATKTRTHNAVNEITAITNTTGPAWEEVLQDAAGNIKVMPDPRSPNAATGYYYDAWNRLVVAQEQATYEYDGLGRRIVKDVYAGTANDRDYYYNEQWQLLESRATSSANPVEQFVWHPYYIDALAVRYYDADTDSVLNEGNDGAQYYCQDANYNVTAVVNASGAVQERYNYTPYGEVTFLNPSYGIRALSFISNSHLYTGRERDPETGLQLNRHRYYASHLGRWLTRDPIGYQESDWNLYEYVRSKPTLTRDPNGLWCWPWSTGPGCGTWSCVLKKNRTECMSCCNRVGRPDRKKCSADCDAKFPKDCPNGGCSISSCQRKCNNGMKACQLSCIPIIAIDPPVGAVCMAGCTLAGAACHFGCNLCPNP